MGVVRSNGAYNVLLIKQRQRLKTIHFCHRLCSRKGTGAPECLLQVEASLLREKSPAALTSASFFRLPVFDGHTAVTRSACCVLTDKHALRRSPFFDVGLLYNQHAAERNHKIPTRVCHMSNIITCLTSVAIMVRLGCGALRRGVLTL